MKPCSAAYLQHHLALVALSGRRQRLVPPPRNHTTRVSCRQLYLARERKSQLICAKKSGALPPCTYTSLTCNLCKLVFRPDVHWCWMCLAMTKMNCFDGVALSTRTFGLELQACCACAPFPPLCLSIHSALPHSLGCAFSRIGDFMRKELRRAWLSDRWTYCFQRGQRAPPALRIRPASSNGLTFFAWRLKRKTLLSIPMLFVALPTFECVQSRVLGVRARARPEFVVSGASVSENHTTQTPPKLAKFWCLQRLHVKVKVA